MANEFELLDSLGEPREFKGKAIYPIKMKDAHTFYQVVQSILVQKNSLGSIDFFKMSYLQFIVFIGEKEPLYENMLETLLKMVFHCEDIKVHVTNTGMVSLIIDDELIISERDFEKLRKVICEQNVLEIDDEYMSPEVRKALDDAIIFKNKKSKSASLGEQIISYHCEMGVSYDEIKELTIYQFQRGIARKNYSKEADFVQAAKYYPMMEFKDTSKLMHWLDKVETSKEDSSRMKVDSFLDGTTGESGVFTKI